MVTDDFLVSKKSMFAAAKEHWPARNTKTILLVTGISARLAGMMSQETSTRTFKGSFSGLKIKNFYVFSHFLIIAHYRAAKKNKPQIWDRRAVPKFATKTCSINFVHIFLARNMIFKKCFWKKYLYVFLMNFFKSGKKIFFQTFDTSWYFNFLNCIFHTIVSIDLFLNR